MSHEALLNRVVGPYGRMVDINGGWLMIPFRKSRFAVPALLAISMMLVLTVAASADSGHAVWSGVGQVLFVGPSQDPSTPTVTQSEFKVKRDGTVRSVTIKTSNELVAGILGGGPGGGAITECRDKGSSTTCDDLNALLTGAVATSLHESTATLSNITESVIQIPIPSTPIILNVPVLSGSLRGKLEGMFAISNGTGIAQGTAKLRIGGGSTGTYACFGNTPFGFLPLESMQPCIDDAGGKLFPVALSVEDSGTFELGQGIGSMSDILGIKGKVQVNAFANMLTEQFGGAIVISDARTDLPGSNPPSDENGRHDNGYHGGHNNGNGNFYGRYRD